MLCFVKVDFGIVNGIYLHDKTKSAFESGKSSNGAMLSDEAKRKTLTKTFSNVKINILLYPAPLHHISEKSIYILL